MVVSVNEVLGEVPVRFEFYVEPKTKGNPLNPENRGECECTGVFIGVGKCEMNILSMFADVNDNLIIDLENEIYAKYC